MAGVKCYTKAMRRGCAVIGAIATPHGKTAAQVMLRWGLQHGRSVIPKSTKAHRIAENIAVFDFELSAEEMTAIDALDTEHVLQEAGRLGEDVKRAMDQP